ncbi:MAG: 3-methyladenine glycosylase [Nocardioides sp.]|nr:3-methyladenine glycosylase [Nocardioides sp.]
MSSWPELRGPAEEVAPRLLGAVLRKGPVAVRLTEVEAYAGHLDPGSHAYRGPTPRNEVMFGPAGFLYCYLSYGMHVCANVVVGEEGAAAAALLRAGEVVEGIDIARSRRPGARTDRDLARGPGRLCQAVGLVLDDDGADLSGPAVELVLPGQALAHEAGPRTGLRLAPDRPWRFWLPGEPTVSLHRRHPKASAHHPDL